MMFGAREPLILLAKMEHFVPKLDLMRFIQKAVSNLDCQKKTFNELLIVLVTRIGWQGRYETAKKDKIVSLLSPV